MCPRRKKPQVPPLPLLLLLLLLLLSPLPSTSFSAPSPPATPPKPTTTPQPTTTKTQYKDNALERFAIRILYDKVKEITPSPPSPPSPPSQTQTQPTPPTDPITFEDFALSTKELLHSSSMDNDDLEGISARIAGALDQATPGFVKFVFRMLANNRIGCELNALVAPLFSKWLIGPARRVDGPVGKEVWESTMLIEKCRYLEAVAGCKHACVYNCKLPTQQFFQESLGVPITMTPDFNDLSCRMCFGQRPPASLCEDPVFQESLDGLSLAADCCSIGDGGGGGGGGSIEEEYRRGVTGDAEEID